MSYQPVRRDRMLSILIVFLFFGTSVLMMIPATVADASDPASSEDGSRASSRVACTNSAAGWTIASGTYDGTCTISGGHIYVNNGITVTFDGISLTHSGSYYFYVYGSLTIVNSTITGASGWNGILGQSNAQKIKVENSVITNFDSYGVRSYTNTQRTEIANSTFTGISASYGIQVYNTNGYGWVNNNTVSNTASYGIYMYYSGNVEVSNNKVSSPGSYGCYLQYYTGKFHNNTINGGNTNTARIYYTGPTVFADNIVKGGNGIGLYVYMTNELTFINNDLRGNNGADISYSTSASYGQNIYMYNTRFAQSTVSGGTIHVFQKANVSAEWLSDGRPAVGAELEITNSKGDIDDRDFVTDANGEVKGIWLKEYEKKSNQISMSPYWINITADLGGRDITNSTQGDIEEGEPNDFEMFLDDVPPPLTISSPTETVITNQTSYVIEGQTERNVSLQYPVMVDMRLGGNIYKTRVNELGSFSQEVTLPSDATHDIIVKAYDSVMNTVEETVTITRDTKDPPLTVTKPDNEHLTNSTTIEVAGTTEAGALVTVNDVPVTVQGTGAFSTMVDLEEGDNIIEIKAEDAAHNWLRIDRLVELDTREPVLIIAEPVDGSKTNEPNIRLIGTTENKATVKVNDAAVVLAGTSFQTFMTLKEGMNVIKVQSCDLAGNCNFTKVDVELDTIVPELTVDEPADELLTNLKDIIVRGTTEAGAEVTVNGRDADILGTEFTFDLELREGKNTVKVEAMDVVGNKASVTKTVYLDTRPPEIVISEPEDGITVNKETLSVEGTTESGALVTVNGKVVALTSGVFETDITLSEGENTIKVVATDEASNSAEVVRKVTLDTKVALDVNDLVEGGDPLVTTASSINISGKADPDATVTINDIIVKLDKKNEFRKEITLDIGENTIYVEAQDPNGNSVVKEYKVTRNEPPPPPKPPGPVNLGNDGFLGGLLLPLLLIIIIVVIIVAVVAVSSKKRKAREQAEEERKRKEAEEEAARQAALQQQQQQMMQQQQAQPWGVPPPPAGMAVVTPPPPPPAQNGYGGYSGYNGQNGYGGINGYQAQPQSASMPPPPVTGYGYAGTGNAYGETGYAEPAPSGAQYQITPEAEDMLDRATRAVEAAEARGEDTSKQRRQLKLAQMFAQKANSEKVIHYSKKALEF